MTQATPELDAEAFLDAARIARERRLHQRKLARTEALAALHRSRDAFRDQADSPEAAERDADRLERLADRLVDWSGVLQSDLDRLELSRDQAVYRGPLLTRRQAPVAAGALAQGLAESFAEDLLSAPAGAVLLAAVRLASA